jgi:plastocyanin
MRSSVVRTLLLVFAVAFVSSACSKSTSTTTPSPGGPSTAPPSQSPSSSEESHTITIGTDMANDHGSKSVSGATSVEVELNDEGSDFYFEPTVLTGTPGQHLTIELSNHSTNGTLHNFSLPDQTIDQDVPPPQGGSPVSVTVTFPQSGFLEFFCKYHRTRGMAGELTV